MSQAGIISTSSGPVPPTVPTSFVTDVNSPAIPAANVLDVFGRQSATNNDQGIQTDGSSGSNVLTVQLTNRASGTATTTSAPDTQTILTLPLDDNSTYQIDVDIVAFATNGLGIMGAKETGTFYRSGGAATLVNTVDSQQNLLNLTGFLAFTSVSGNNVIVQAFGSPGFNVDWKALLTYTKVS